MDQSFRVSLCVREATLRRRISCCFVLAAMTIAIGIVYWYGGVLARAGVAHAIEARLPDVVGPARHYTASVSGSALGMLRGQAKRVLIIGDKVELRNGLTLSRFTADMTGIRLSATRDRITHVDHASFTATTTEQQLNHYLANRFADVPDCRVDLREDGAAISAKPEIAGLPVELKADGRIRIADGHKVVFEVSGVSAEGLNLPTPGFVRDYLEKHINPILDTAGWELGLRLQSVKTTPDFITLTGTARLAAMQEPM